MNLKELRKITQQLKDKNTYSIYTQLSKESLSVEDLTFRLFMSQSSISSKLSILSKLKLITFSQQGRYHVYKITGLPYLITELDKVTDIDYLLDTTTDVYSKVYNIVNLLYKLCLWGFIKVIPEKGCSEREIYDNPSINADQSQACDIINEGVKLGLLSKEVNSENKRKRIIKITAYTKYLLENFPA